MNKTRLFFLFLFLFGTGCTPRYQDITGLTTRKVYELPTNIYYGLAWLSDKKIALAYEHDLKGAQNGAVGLYDLDSEEMIIVPQPDMPEYCIRGWNTGGLERLPDGNLGFMFDCIDDTLVDQYSLVKWNPNNNQLQELFNYQDDIFATVFSFSPRMDKYVQEDSTNISMGNQLFKISLVDGSMTQLAPDFVRAKMPSWSSQSNLIAFWGTQNYPTKSENYKEFNDIKNLVLHPWDLYTMDQNGGNIQKMLAGVESPGVIKWSPSQNVLGFGGTVNGVEGVWLYDPETKALMRVFNRSELFDWSVDGTELIVVEHKLLDGITEQKIQAYVIELPTCVIDGECK